MYSFVPKFGAALGGVLLSLAVQSLVFWLLQRRGNSGHLIGNWISSYQGIEEPEGVWVTEKVQISRALSISGSATLRGYRLKNRESSRGYDYLAIGNLSKDDYIIGDWESIKPDNTSNRGVFVLTIGSSSVLMYGYWAGQDISRAHRYGRWVLVKDVKGAPSINFAKGLLSEMRKPGKPLDFEGIQE